MLQDMVHRNASAVIFAKQQTPEVQLCQVPGFGKVEYQFFGTGKGKVVIEYESRKAGKQSVEV